jgi:hypothetical protein
MEAHRELLQSALNRVDDDVGGVAVDPGDTGRLDPDTGFLCDLTDDGDRVGLPDLDPAARKFPVAVIDATNEQDPVVVIAHDRIDDHDEPTHRWRVRRSWKNSSIRATAGS